MSEVMDYKSRLSDPASRKFETFSYLPPMDKDNIRKQVEYLVKKGWNPAIEHTEPEHLMDSYWYMWKLPMFGETDVDRILGKTV
jgi:ribulose-bisphosphate carboxylase small chain